ncbi:MAG: hypothetical protein JKY65_12480 [Planctomycetes bacterium]|nr:hypothetical protein [Planctomycetota bacterium]
MTRTSQPLLLTLFAFLGLAGTAFALSDAEVAARYAPVIYQEFSIYDDQPLDYLRRVDFDGDWNTRNNLDNAERSDVDNRGYVYFEVKETETHYFVTYYLYYARKAIIFNIKSENHSAGCVVVARKNAKAGQEIELFFTTGSGDKLSLIQTENAKKWDRRKIENPRNGRKRKVSVKKTMAFDDADIDPNQNHPRLAVDPWDHKAGVRRRPTSRFDDRPYPFFTGRGIVYHPHSTVPHRSPTPGAVVVGYALLPLSDLDQVQNLDESKTHILGSKSGKAQLPGAWKVPAPGFPTGALQKDPARVVAELFKVRGEFSRTYLPRSESTGLNKVLAGATKPK